MLQEQIEKLHASISGAPLVSLDTIVSAVYAAWGRGEIGDDEATALQDAVDERRKELRREPGASIGNLGGPMLAKLLKRPRGVGSRPKTPENMIRRRRWCASGWLPPQLAAQFTQGERAVLSVYAAECASRGLCRFPLDRVAAAAGVSRTIVKRTVRLAQALGILKSDEWRISNFRNAPNTVTIVSDEWTTWLRMRMRSAPTARGGGVTVVSSMSTEKKEPFYQAVGSTERRTSGRAGGRHEPFLTPELMRSTAPWGRMRGENRAEASGIGGQR